MRLLSYLPDALRVFTWPNPTRVGNYYDSTGSYLVKTACMLQISNPSQEM